MALIIRPSSFDNNRRQHCRWHVSPSPSSVEFEAAQEVFNSAQQAIQQRGAFHIVLAGGTTPRRVYELLSAMNADWSRWHIYFGDERCLPASHADRNSLMAAQAWLNHVGIPPGQIHNIPAEQGAEKAAHAYESTLNTIDQFDLVLLGLGEDGHTASLFPGQNWGSSADYPYTLAVHHAPKPPPDRVTLTAYRLSQTRQLFFLISGLSKKQAIQKWRNGENIPASAIAPECGADIFLEQNLLDQANNTPI